MYTHGMRRLYLDGGVDAVALVAGEGPVNDVLVQVAQAQLLLRKTSSQCVSYRS